MNRRLAVAFRIPGEADSGRGVKQLTLHAAVGNAILAALHESVGDHWIQAVQGIVGIEEDGIFSNLQIPAYSSWARRGDADSGSQCRIEGVGIPIPGV